MNGFGMMVAPCRTTQAMCLSKRRVTRCPRVSPRGFFRNAVGNSPGAFDRKRRGGHGFDRMRGMRDRATSDAENRQTLAEARWKAIVDSAVDAIIVISA